MPDLLVEATQQQEIEKKLSSCGVEPGSGRYTAIATVVWCSDARCDAPLTFILNCLSDGTENKGAVDLLKIAGGAKALTPSGTKQERQFVLDQIRMFFEHHSSRKIILMLHTDCAAYDGIRPENHFEEVVFLHAELEAARETVRRETGYRVIRCVLVASDGTYEF